MSLQPELLLRAYIARGIKALRNDSRLIDQLFRNLDQRSINEIRNFLKNYVIELALNYPYETLKVPAIVILLKSESEAQAYLNDTMGLETPDTFAYDSEVAGQILGGAASVTSLFGEPKTVFGPWRASSATLNTLKIVTLAWDIDQYRGDNFKVKIVGGTGAGQILPILSNGKTNLNLGTNWTTLPDNTSVFEIIQVPEEVVGEPSKLYDRRVFGSNSFIERKGSLYQSTYQIQVIGPNPEMTIALHTILKAIFTINRVNLEAQGIINFKLNSTDFMPKTEYMPDRTYMRSIEMTFMYPFDVFVQLGNLASSLQITLEDSIETVLSDVQDTLKFPNTTIQGP